MSGLVVLLFPRSHEMASSPRDGEGDLTLRPHGEGLARAGPAKPFFGAALDLKEVATTTTPTMTMTPSPLLRAALTNSAVLSSRSSSLGGGGGSGGFSAPPPQQLDAYLTPQPAALAAELSALAVMGSATTTSTTMPLEVDAARDGAPPEGAPLHLVVKKVRMIAAVARARERERERRRGF